MGTYANFYNSNNGDRIYDAEAFAEWLKPFFKTGVFNNELQVVASSGMNVVVKSGNAYIEGKLKKFDNETVLTLEPASSTVDRIDAIVVRRNDTERDFTIQVIKGSTNAPQPVREGGIYDIVLAHISVPMATTEVTQALITDTRMNENICGWVVSNIEEVDFNQITAQFSDYLARFEADNLQEFTDWFNLIKDQLTTDQAGALWTAIEGVNASIDQINTDVKAFQTDIDNVKFGDVCGKNLVDWSKASHTFYNYSNGSINNSNNYYGVLEHFETKGQKLTLSFDITSNVVNAWCAIALYDENKNYLRNDNGYATELSVVPNSNEKYATFALYSSNTSLSRDDYYNVQLEYGDRTSYEPYVPSLKKLNSNIANISPLIAYPIGSVYMSVNSTNPSTIFGGTWEQLKDRFLLGCGDTYTNGATGGEATHTLTVDEMPSHSHALYRVNENACNGGTSSFSSNSCNSGWTMNSLATGGSQAHNNMPPYLAVYMWKRTA